LKIKRREKEERKKKERRKKERRKDSAETLRAQSSAKIARKKLTFPGVAEGKRKGTARNGCPS